MERKNLEGEKETRCVFARIGGVYILHASAVRKTCTP